MRMRGGLVHGRGSRRPPLPPLAPDITAARTHNIITTCERLKIPALADKAYQGAGGTFATPVKRAPEP